MPVEPLPCTPSGGGPGGPDPGCGAAAAVLRLCDVDVDCTPFLRHLVHDCDGEVIAQRDTTLDGITPYTPAGAQDCAACQDGS